MGTQPKPSTAYQLSELMLRLYYLHDETMVTLPGNEELRTQIRAVEKTILQALQDATKPATTPTSTNSQASSTFFVRQSVDDYPEFEKSYPKPTPVKVLTTEEAAEAMEKHPDRKTFLDKKRKNANFLLGRPTKKQKH